MECSRRKGVFTDRGINASPFGWCLWLGRGQLTASDALKLGSDEQRVCSDCAENDSGPSDMGRKMRGVATADDEEEGPSYQDLDGESYEPCCEAPSSRWAMMGGRT